jgi:hypothetical protein
MQFDFRNKAVAFWKRHTQSPATRRQRVFDAIFGILIPAFCVIVGGAVLDEALAPLALFAYLEFMIESIALGYYLLFCPSSQFLVGVLLAGALFSCLIAIVFLLLIPFVAMGFVFWLSQLDLALFCVFALILSVVPMATAFVFWRNTERCLKGGRNLQSRTRPRAVTALACILTVGAPVAIQLVVFRVTHYSTQVVLSGSEGEVPRAVRTLKWLYFLPSVNVEQLARSYKSSTDPNLRERLSKAYRLITGRSIEHLSRDFHPM